MVTAIEREGVRVYPVERHAVRKREHFNEIILGYGHLTPEQIEQGIRRIKVILG